jgi:trehalose 6-phosphate synthase/phosphatase
VFRTLPWRNQIVRGLLGADLIGFHAGSYLRHFMSSLAHVDGAEVDIDRVRLRDRTVRLGVFPMGVDAATFSAAADTPEVLAAAETIRRDAGGRAIVLGIDRLDYTKGIPRRLAAIERLLTRTPALRDQVRYIQVAVPSRGEVDSYQRFRRDVEERIGRINGTMSTVRSTPIHYVHQSVPFEQLVALYRAADVMLVTPLRDGMNLVAKEFVASRPDGNGALVLSEFAGAASELDGALLINPYDVDGVATAVEQALAMGLEERQARMNTMRRRVASYDVHRWAADFLETLNDCTAPVVALDDMAASSLMAELQAARAGDIRLLLDYDGTLVPYAELPEQAAPDAELMALLAQLAATPGIHVDIVSGRPKDTLESWFGHLPVALWAEHGFWSRLDGDEWRSGAELHVGWLERVRPILEHFTASTPGSFIESKAASLAWHYRNAAPEFAARQAHELRLLLDEALRHQPFEVLRGRKVIEVRRRSISKATVAEHLRRTGSAATVVALGDDHTDEDLFEALPADSLTIAVGDRATRARFVLRDYRDVRRLLRSLIAMAHRPLLSTVAASHAAGLLN